MNLSRFIFSALLGISLMVHLSGIVTCSCLKNRKEYGMDEKTAGAMSQEINTDLPCEEIEESVCHTSGCNSTAKSILENMDDTVRPCDDFYQFSCGKFLKNTKIPSQEDRVTPYTLINQNLTQQLRSIVEEDIKPNEIKPFKLAKILYRSCMNEKLIEDQGLHPLEQMIEKLGGWPVLKGDQWKDIDFNWKKIIKKSRQMGFIIFYFFNFGVSVDIKNNTKNLIYLDQTSLNIPREFLLKGTNDTIVNAYYKYMTDVAEILGADKNLATKELMESLEFEIKLANISLSREERMRNITALYNPKTVRELKRQFPTIPWFKYINIILNPVTSVNKDEVIVLMVPSFLSKLLKLLEDTPKRVQANYLIWTSIMRIAPYLNEKIRNKTFEFSSKQSGTTEREPRWKECEKLALSKFPIAIGSLYVKKYFNEDAKNATVEMVTGIMGELKKTLETVNWMDEHTRKAALEKIEFMKAVIAYSDELLLDAKIEEVYNKYDITSGNYLQSMFNISRTLVEENLENLRKAVIKHDWKDYAQPALVNAYYKPIKNTIVLPAGVLQGTFFSNDRPKYMNYGSIGTIIGHEITHGFDTTGRQFDKEGNLVNWWQRSTMENYLKKVKCIIDQYDNYTVSELSLKVSGGKTQGENIADHGGIKHSYLAYNEWARKNGPEPKLPGLESYSPQQMYWISLANTWCSKYQPELFKNRIETGVHSPPEFRVNGPLSNMPEFSRDFNCKVGSKMNPQKKCSVW